MSNRGVADFEVRMQRVTTSAVAHDHVAGNLQVLQGGLAQLADLRQGLRERVARYQNGIGAADVEKNSHPLLQQMFERLESNAGVTEVFKQDLLGVIRGGNADDRHF